MKITISMPDEVYVKLERDRGSVPRSTYIQDLINCFGKGVGNITPQHILGKSEDVYGNHPPEGRKYLVEYVFKNTGLSKDYEYIVLDSYKEAVNFAKELMSSKTKVLKQDSGMGWHEEEDYEITRFCEVDTFEVWDVVELMNLIRKSLEEKKTEANS